MAKPADTERPEGRTQPQQGQTTASRPVPRQPHERDESADSQAAGEASGQRIGRLAQQDVAAGRVDTDKGPVLDAAYEPLRDDSAPPRK